MESQGILMNALNIIIIYIFIANIVGFSVMGIDKHKARNRQFRIPEAFLFFISLIGGSIGTIIGMYFFRHKTKHLSFKILLPLILILHIALIVLLLKVLPLEFIIM